MADVMTRRIASWLITAALAAAAFVGYRMLPGGDLASELRWRLASGSYAQQRQALSLLLVALNDQKQHASSAASASPAASLKRKPQRVSDVAFALLTDESPAVRNAACRLVMDTERERLPLSPDIADGVRQAFAVLTDEQREESCWLLSRLLLRVLCYVSPGELSEAEIRWATAYVTIPGDLCSGARCPVHEIPSCILGEDHACPCLVYWYAIPYRRTYGLFPTLRRSPSSFESYYDPPHMIDQRFSPLLNDPAPRVRWGAAFLLIRFGDWRAWPTLCEWLENDAPNAPPPDIINQELLVSIFPPRLRDEYAGGF